MSNTLAKIHLLKFLSQINRPGMEENNLSVTYAALVLSSLKLLERRHGTFEEPLSCSTLTFSLD